MRNEAFVKMQKKKKLVGGGGGEGGRRVGGRGQVGCERRSEVVKIQKKNPTLNPLG